MRRQRRAGEKKKRKEATDYEEDGSYREVKLLEHAMKIIERIQKRQVLTLINVNKMQFGYMPRKGTVAVIFIVRRMQEEYKKKDKKLYMCFVDIEKNI